MRAALWLTGVCVLGHGPASGQEQYTLSEQDTWELEESADPATPEGRLAAARRALAEGRSQEAERLADAWIEQHDRHPLLPEAYVVRGDALRAQRDYYGSLFDYEYVARAFPASEAFVTVLERELEIAILYAHGLKRKFLGMRLLDAGDIAEELLIRIQERLPGSRLAERAAMELADFYFYRREMDLAVEMYSIFLENHPTSDQVPKARRRLIFAHLATFKGPEFDAAGLHEARAKIQELLVLEPAAAEQMGAEALLTRIDESDAQKMLATARWYLTTGDPVASELMIRRLVQQYPRTVAAAEALRLTGRIVPQLPASILDEAPDYAALRQAFLGDGRSPDAGAPPDGEPEP